MVTQLTCMHFWWQCKKFISDHLVEFLQETEEELLIPPPPPRAQSFDDDNDVERRLQSLLDVAEEDQPEEKIKQKDFSGLKELDRIGYVVRNADFHSLSACCQLGHMRCRVQLRLICIQLVAGVLIFKSFQKCRNKQLL